MLGLAFVSVAYVSIPFEPGGGVLSPVVSSEAEAATLAVSPERDYSDRKREIFVNLRAALVIDNSTGEPLYAFNAENQRPIASISKLLAAMTLLDMGYVPDSLITITREDARRSSKSAMRRGDQATAHDLLLAALIGSDNRSARALARTFGGSYSAFTEQMNATAKRLGLQNTHMVEPTGLDEGNTSTAVDCAVLANAALKYPEIVEASGKKIHRISVTNRRGRQRTRRIVTTNRLVYSKYHTLIGKTGYIRASDYCLTTVIENKRGERLTVVALGAPWSSTRFKEARRLVDYGFRKLRKARQEAEKSSASAKKS